MYWLAKFIIKSGPEFTDINSDELAWVYRQYFSIKLKTITLERYINYHNTTKLYSDRCVKIVQSTSSKLITLKIDYTNGNFIHFESYKDTLSNAISIHVKIDDSLTEICYPVRGKLTNLIYKYGNSDIYDIYYTNSFCYVEKNNRYYKLTHDFTNLELISLEDFDKMKLKHATEYV